jgi:hypothetical protein
MPGKVQTQKHHAALPYSEIGSFMTLNCVNEQEFPHEKLEFSLLTVSRSGEVRGADG